MRGGPSAEREISLHTGASVARALRLHGHHVHEFDPRERRIALPPETQVVFLALHGEYGEDGTIQRQLEDLGVLYTGCGIEASRLAFDKVLTKQRCIERGIPTARHVVINRADAPWPPGWEPPVVLKPVRQGSSVGLQYVENTEAWPDALAESLCYDTQVLIEEKIIGRETTVAILGGKALPVVEVRPKQGRYDYQSKYVAGRSDYFCPAPFDEATTRRIQATALRAFRAIGGRDYARVDVMVRDSGEPVVLEVNTLPGMTETSLFPKAADAAGISYPELCQRMIDLAVKRVVRRPPHSAPSVSTELHTSWIR